MYLDITINLMYTFCLKFMARNVSSFSITLMYTFCLKFMVRNVFRYQYYTAVHLLLKVHGQKYI